MLSIGDRPAWADVPNYESKEDSDILGGNSLQHTRHATACWVLRPKAVWPGIAGKTGNRKARRTKVAFRFEINMIERHK